MTLRNYLLAGLTLLAANSFGTIRISGGMSNFDCWNDENDDAEGFEIEIEDFRPEDIQGTYGGSAFGGPTLRYTGHSMIVRYYNSNVHLPHGAMTHFGVHSNKVMPAASLKYRWVFNNSFGTGTYTMTKKMPKHDVQLITLDDGSQAVRDVIVNTEPNDGQIFFFLPYRIDVPGVFSLNDLMSNNSTVLGATPMGDGPDGLTPEQLDPGNVWGNDDVVESGDNTSQIFWYKIYDNAGTDQDPVVGNMIGVMIDNTVTSAAGLQAIQGPVNLQNIASSVGRQVQVDFFSPGGTTALQSYLQPIN
ncbi:MAG: hypothetical protein K8R88_14235, partial [Armatimonadetes bacterium]|nr:hypothetical protein [Armatimonadota bacterium]